MNIGDKVRVIHGTEEGVIIRVLPDGLIDIEIEDGFTIPVLAKDVVIIQPGFQDIKETTKRDEKTTKTTPVGLSGLFLAINVKTQDIVEVFFINNTDLTILLAAGKTSKDDYRGLSSEKVKNKSYLKIDQTTFQKLQEEKYTFDYIIHEPSRHSVPKIYSKSVRPKASSLQKNKQTAPLLNQEMHLVQLDADAIKVDPEFIKENIEQRQGQSPVSVKSEKIVNEIDLHIEALTDDYQFLSSEEMLNLQLETFEKTLDKAIAYGLDEITFIHGVGNGKLRMEIHRILGKHDNVAWFKDAAKQKFGYGATLVKIK